MKRRRPIAIIVLAILTFAALSPALIQAVYDRLTRDPLEVAFRYPRPDAPQLDAYSRLALTFSVWLAQAGLFILGIITGIGILKKQRWSWFAAIILFALVIAIYLIAVILLPPYTSSERIASMVISAGSFYLLSRKDVREYFRGTVKQGA